MNRITLTIVRVGTGLLFLQHGLQKVFGIMGGFGGVAGATAPFMSKYGPAMILETVGALFLILGLFTRPIAALCLVEMIVAYFLNHSGRPGFPVQNGGELALVDALLFLVLAVQGAGAYSLDELISRRK